MKALSNFAVSTRTCTLLYSYSYSDIDLTYMRVHCSFQPISWLMYYHIIHIHGDITIFILVDDFR